MGRYTHVFDDIYKLAVIIPKKTNLNRKERRINEREESKKIKRQIDWNKVKKSFGELVLIGFAFGLLIFCFSFYVITKQNNIRKSVEKQPQTTTAKITYIGGKGVRSAEYEYIINGEKYENSTFHSFNGNVGDEICIEYSITEPNISLYCNEKETENIKEDVILFTLKMFCLIIFGAIALIFIQLIIGNKKLMVEMTSRK